MLASLVALAVRRMHNLESFIWDMPTGVLREVWEALEVLGKGEHEASCRLERLWVRWHDNRQSDPAVTGDRRADHEDFDDEWPHPISASGVNARPRDVQRSIERVEHPTLSIVPPLKSLSVLEIDELAYLDEMSILIDRSKNRLRELRVSMARHVVKKDWVAPWEGDGAEDAIQRDADGTTHINSTRKRKGGVLGTVFSRALNSMQQAGNATSDPKPVDNAYSTLDGQCTQQDPAEQVSSRRNRDTQTRVAPLARRGPAPRFVEHLPDTALDRGIYNAYKYTDSLSSSRRSYQHPLPIEILELERVPLSVNVMQTSLDWTRLTELTLLGCEYSDKLWRALWHLYKPESLKQSMNDSSNPKTCSLPMDSSDYPLKLRKIHVDIISPVLMSFIKKALAPNTLEILFLQWAKTHWSNVTVEQIVRGPLRRHRASLQKLVIDSNVNGVIEMSGAER